MAHGRGGGRADDDIRQEAQAIWGCLLRLSYMQDRLGKAGMLLGSITLRPPSVEGADWLGVVRMRMQDIWYVGFISGREVSGVFQSMVSKIENDSIQWKEDQFANGKRD